MHPKQEAFVKSIAQEYPDVPHRYCQNHFLRNLAKPTLEKDSSAKVQMRKKVRGLRDIEREVLEQRRERQPAQGHAAMQDKEKKEVVPAEPAVEAVSAGEPVNPEGSSEPDPVQVVAQDRTAVPSGSSAEQTAGGNEAAEQVVLDYCAAVRGILNDDQGGPLHPPGLRMAEALTEVRESLQRCLDLNKPGPAHGQLEQLAECIDSGLA